MSSTTITPAPPSTVRTTRTTFASVDPTVTLVYVALGGRQSPFLPQSFERSKATIQALFNGRKGTFYQDMPADKVSTRLGGNLNTGGPGFNAYNDGPSAPSMAAPAPAISLATLNRMPAGSLVSALESGALVVNVPATREPSGHCATTSDSVSALVARGHARGVQGYETTNWQACNAQDELANLRARITAERRRSVKVPTHAVRMTIGGKVQVPATGDHDAHLVAPESAAISQLFSRVALAADCESPGNAMADWHGAALVLGRAQAFNGMALQAETHAKATGDDDATTTMIRERVNMDGELTMFAVLSDRYTTSIDTHHVAGEIAESLNGQNKADVRCRYNGQSARITVRVGNPKPAKDAKVGDMFAFGFAVTTDDTGRGALKIVSYAERLACTNGMTRKVNESAAAIRHSGRNSRVVDRMRTVLEEVMRGMDQWVMMFDAAASSKLHALNGRNVPILYTSGRRNASNNEAQVRLDNLLGQARDGSGDTDLVNAFLVSGTLRALMHEKRLPVNERGADDVVGNLLRAHEDRRNDSIARVGGPSIASIVNACSLYAHDAVSCGASENLSLDAQAEWEAASGELLSAGNLPWMLTDVVPTMGVRSLRA